MKRLPNGRIVHGDPTPMAGEPPPAVTEARVTELVNGAVTGALKNFQEKQLPGLFKPVNETLASITESLRTLSEAAPKAKEPAAAAAGDVETNTVITGLRKQLDTLTKTQADEVKRREAAETAAQNTQKESKIRTLLDQFEFVNADAKEDAFSLVSPLITRDADGNLIGGDLTADAFIKDFIPAKKGHLLAPVNTKGGGPAPGARRIGGAQVGIESIKPGMSQADLSAVAAAIRNASSEQRS